MRRMETPVRYISMMASSTLVSCLLQRSMTAVAKRMLLSFGIFSVTWPDVVVKPPLVVSRLVRRPLVGALIWAGADELVGLLVEHRVDGLLHGFPGQLAQ